MTIEPTNDLDTLRQWVGRTKTATDTIRVEWARFMQQSLDQAPDAQTADPLAPLWHSIYFLESERLSNLSRDGHPERGGFLPPVLMPRRMWAGSTVEFLHPIPLGVEAVKTSTVEQVEMKSGASGDLCFVKVRHEISVDEVVAVREHQDLVYRDDPHPDAPKPQPKPVSATSAWTRTITPSAVMLFRFSALTFNGHRIHYDREYARTVEGYPGLVFHGPLTATNLAALARDHGGELATFSFRSTAPLFDDAPFTIHGNPTDTGAELWARTPDGGLAMTATATFAG